MDSKNFLNFHVLISHSPSCLNRDDMNMQKSATFGGVRRVRISSQSLKRAIRNSAYYKENFGERSDRTRILMHKISQDLSEEIPSRREAIFETACYAAAILEGKTKEKEIKSFKDSEVKKAKKSESEKLETQVLPFSKHEQEGLRKIVSEISLLDSAEQIEALKKEIKDLEDNEKGKFPLDVALSGRMANSDLIHSVEGALAVAHVITTHEAEADIDWFTAVDDFVSEEGEMGAGHLDTQEFSSGVFYRYASLNIAQLQKNLGQCSREDALKVGSKVLHMLATIVPSAKQQSFAAHNLADLALVNFSSIPISLANAFEAPIQNDRGGGYIHPSIKALLDYWDSVHCGFGIDENTALFSLRDCDPNDQIQCFSNLNDLKNWISSDASFVDEESKKHEKSAVPRS